MTRPLDPYWPSHASEPTHDKNYDVAEALGIHVMQAYGHIRAFRTRYPQEAPTGRLRGGDEQVERLALWDGPKGALAAAFRASGVVDVDEAGRLVAHEHDEFVGAALEQRTRAKSSGAQRTEKWRQKKAEEGDSSVTSPVTGACDVTGDTSCDVSPPLLTFSLSSDLNSAERGSRGEDSPPTPGQRAEQRERSHVVGEGLRQKQAHLAKTEAIYDRPQTPEALLATLVDGVPIGSQWRARFKALDGKAGRPTIPELVQVLWEYSLAQRWAPGGKAVLAWFSTKLSTDNDKHRRAWERDGGTTASSPDPLWPKWRDLKAAGADVPGFDEWKLKQAELSGGRKGSGQVLPVRGSPASPTMGPEDEATVAKAKEELARISGSSKLGNLMTRAIIDAAPGPR